MWSFFTLNSRMFLSFEQFIRQQMVRFQIFILEHLHHHTLSNMLFDRIFEAHYARIPSCYGPMVGVWFTIWPIFLGFWLVSLVFSIVFWIWLRLPHPSIVGIFQCVCTHPIDLMGIHLLRRAHGNERTWTHDALCDTFATIV
jgi:hypothetical protein